MSAHLVTTPALENLDDLCTTICRTLEREHAVLRGSNGLIGQGVEDLEQIQVEKSVQIERLEVLSKSAEATDEARANPERAEDVRANIERCKQLQYRNHQVFSRIVAVQRRILTALRPGDDDLSLYDRAGRTRDFGLGRLANHA